MALMIDPRYTYDAPVKVTFDYGKDIVHKQGNKHVGG